METPGIPRGLLVPRFPPLEASAHPGAAKWPSPRFKKVRGSQHTAVLLEGVLPGQLSAPQESELPAKPRRDTGLPGRVGRGAGCKPVTSFFITFKFFTKTVAIWIPHLVPMMISTVYSIFNVEDSMNGYGSFFAFM